MPRPVFCVRVTEQSRPSAPSMVRPGKQPADAESSLDQREAPESVPDPRSLNGINRHAHGCSPTRPQPHSARLPRRLLQ